MAVATDKGACNGLKRFDLLMSWRDGTKVCDLVCVEVHANKARRPGHALLDAYGSPEHAVEAASRQARVDAEFTHPILIDECEAIARIVEPPRSDHHPSAVAAAFPADRTGIADVESDTAIAVRSTFRRGLDQLPITAYTFCRKLPAARAGENRHAEQVALFRERARRFVRTVPRQELEGTSQRVIACLDPKLNFITSPPNMAPAAAGDAIGRPARHDPSRTSIRTAEEIIDLDVDR